MAFKVKFDNGYSASFENEPTQEDIDAALAQIQKQHPPKVVGGWQGALQKAGDISAKGLDFGVKAMNAPGEYLAETPVGKLAAGTVGLAGSAIGGVVGAVGETGIQAVKAAQGKGFDVGKIGESAMRTAKDTGQFGQEIGREGVVQAPLALLAAPGELAAAGTKLSTALKAKGVARTTAKDAKALEQAIELSKPVILPSKQAGAIIKQGTEAQTALKPAKLKSTAKDIERGTLVKEILGPEDLKKPSSETIPKLEEARVQKAKDLRGSLEETTYKPLDLRSQIESIPKPTGVKGALANKTWQSIKDAFLKKLSPNLEEGGAMAPRSAPISEVLDSRQLGDTVVTDQLPANWTGSKTPFTKGVKEIRDLLNKHIADQYADLTKGQALQAGADEASALKLASEAKQAVEKSLREQHLLYEATQNMAKKAATGKTGSGMVSGEFKTGKVQAKLQGAQKVIKDNPIAAGIGLGATALGTAAAGKKILGL